MKECLRFNSALTVPFSISLIVLFSTLFFNVAVNQAQAQEVFFSPDTSNVDCCSPFTVDIYANATYLQGGQLNISYEPNCINITGWSASSSFNMGGWESHFEGREYITFLKQLPPISGLTKVGTLTMNCEGSCSTILKFETDDIAKESAIFDSAGIKIDDVVWNDGHVLCNMSFDSPPEVNITYPYDGQVFTDNGAITVNGTSSDDVGVSKVELNLNNGGWQGVTGLIIWSKSVSLVEGENSICAKATDTIGQEGQMCLNVTLNINPCVKYDTNGTPGIQLSEAVNAITDYFSLKIDLQTVVTVIMCYFG